jgi:hypothetical protein
MRYLAFIIGASLWLGKISAKPSTGVGGSTSEIVAVQKQKSGTSLISAQTPILGPQVPLASGGSSLLFSPGLYRTPSPIFGIGGDRCVSEGSVVGDVYYGALSGFLVKLSAAFKDIFAEDVKTTIIGPIGLRAEYMFSDVVGLGADLQFNRYTITWRETDYDDYLGVYHDYYYKEKWMLVRAMARVAFHFAVRRAVDPYVAISGGLRILTISTEETNDPSYKEDEGGVGAAGRLALGTRFFFTPNIGAFAEVGVFGGGLFHFGLSFKLK